MKKILSIIMLVAAFTIASTSVKAKSYSGASAIPTFNQICNSENVESLFKNRGFKITKKREYSEKYEETITYITATYSSGNVSCKFVEDLYGFKITITGAASVLDKFLSDAKAWINSQKRKNPDDPWIQRMFAEKSGNTIRVFFGGD